MTLHEHPIFAAERKTNPCQHPKKVNPPLIRLLLVFRSEIWSKPWPFMDNSALRPPIGTGSLPLSNVTGSLCTSMSPKVTQCVGLGCKSFHSMGGICIIIWALFALVLSLHISLEALAKPKQGSSLRKGCVRPRPHNCTDSAHGMK